MSTTRKMEADINKMLAALTEQMKTLQDSQANQMEELKASQANQMEELLKASQASQTKTFQDSLDELKASQVSQTQAIQDGILRGLSGFKKELKDTIEAIKTEYRPHMARVDQGVEADSNEEQPEEKEVEKEEPVEEEKKDGERSKAAEQPEVSSSRKEVKQVYPMREKENIYIYIYNGPDEEKETDVKEEFKAETGVSEEKEKTGEPEIKERWKELETTGDAEDGAAKRKVEELEEGNTNVLFPKKLRMTFDPGL